MPQNRFGWWSVPGDQLLRLTYPAFTRSLSTNSSADGKSLDLRMGGNGKMSPSGCGPSLAVGIARPAHHEQ
jgi:hypothetical protein